VIGEEVLDKTVTETNCFAASYIHGCNLKLKLRMNNWWDVTRDKLYVVSGLLVVVGVV
jgi:hypothetical protein